MRLTCPCCGATLSLEALLNDVAARQAVATALALPANLGPRLLRYLGLFRPEKRSLTWDRAASLLAELQTMIAAGSIRRHGRDWPAPHAVWSAALDAVLERQNLTLPLKSHGYLLEIIAGQANRTEAVQEEHLEEMRRQPRPDSGAGMQAISALLASAPLGDFGCFDSAQHTSAQHTSAPLDSARGAASDRSLSDASTALSNRARSLSEVEGNRD